MHKILLNCSTLVKGGALQVARSIFEEASVDTEIDWYFAINEGQYLLIADLLDKGLKSERLIILKASPARNRQMRDYLKTRVKEFDLDAVFTLFGPAYINFTVPHLCGIADGWVTHATKEAYTLLPNIKEKIHTFLLSQYKLWWYKKADRWCVEAQMAKEGYQLKSQNSSETIFVIPNAVNQIFQDYATQIIERSLNNIINIFCLGADYWHKNLQIIPDVLCALKEKSKTQYHFIITLPSQSPIYLKLIQSAKEKGVEKHIINIGTLTLKEVVEQYKKCDILFFPSVLETFSITPLEALYMNMPMVVSNISSNKEVLKEYAIYVNPFDIKEITEQLIYLALNYSKEVKKLQILKQNNYFKSLVSAQKRFVAYKSILKKMMNELSI